MIRSRYDGVPKEKGEIRLPGLVRRWVAWTQQERIFPLGGKGQRLELGLKAGE